MELVAGDSRTPLPLGNAPFSSSSGEMAQLLASLDWSRTKLGAPERWPPALRTVVGLVLGNRFPMLLWWGKDLIQIYNDAYRPILGDKHPRSAGAPGPEVWREIWHIIGPQAESIWNGGPATWNEHLLLPMIRKGYLEETYFTFSYSPVPDDDGEVGGVLVTCQETTDQVRDARQLRTLRDLAAQASEATSIEQACETAARILEANDADVPFAAIYLASGDGRSARLASRAGFPRGEHPSLPSEIALDGESSPWPLAEVVARGESRLVSDLERRVGPMPAGRWPTPPRAAVVLPLAHPGAPRPHGVLVCGVSPLRTLDERYVGFLQLVADQIATTLANVHAHEEEQRRLRALEELDRAKTAFFANVSHEFRTPLTLMLGPTEDALRSPSRSLSGESLELVHRNQLRLMRLVNSLLDFARIEAGRVQAVREPTDLAQLTADLASGFRSAIERGGLSLVVDAEPVGRDVQVDRGMWENIVLNLLSNAFKFTFQGEIVVRLRRSGDRIVLSVRDTGVGIAADELPRVFDRFHRVEGARARTHEGSGIGLALVSELARMHGGEVRVESELGRGSTFTVSIALDAPRVQGERFAPAPPSRALGIAPFVEEALRWTTEAGAGALAVAAGSDPIATWERRARILVADDNADMREYLGRILGARWQVTACADGATALASARAAPPDLVLCDVMMPGLDGFGLLRELRAEARTAAVPVVMVSARAEEEAHVDALSSGADDYVVKPFGARELVARVSTQLAVARTRRLLEQQRADQQALFQQAEAASRAKDELLATLGHELRNPLAPIVTVLHLMRLRAPDVLVRERQIVERQVKHMTRLVEDLLDVSRIKSGKVSLDKRRVDLGTVVASATEMASPLIEERSHHLEVTVEPNLLVAGDEARLAQVVSNLLTNAAKYTPVGGHIALEATREGGHAVVRVVDDGKGIAAELLPRVFDLFVQGAAGEERTGGLGLGLTIVRSLAVMHGGSVHVESDGPGKGSTFTLRLPLLPSSSAEPGLSTAEWSPEAPGAAH